MISIQAFPPELCLEYFHLYVEVVQIVLQKSLILLLEHLFNRDQNAAEVVFQRVTVATGMGLRIAGDDPLRGAPLR